MQKACAKWVSFAFKALKHSFHVLEWWKSYPISTSNSAKIFSLFTFVGGRQQSNLRDRTNFSDCDKTYADKLQKLFPVFETERNRCLTSQLTIRKCFVSIWFLLCSSTSATCLQNFIQSKNVKSFRVFRRISTSFWKYLTNFSWFLPLSSSTKARSVVGLGLDSEFWLRLEIHRGETCFVLRFFKNTLKSCSVLILPLIFTTLI